MSFPVRAFQVCDIGEIKKGQFFLLGQDWYLAVEYVGQSNQSFSAVRVTSTDNTQGTIWTDIDQRYKVLRIASPFTTEVHSDIFPERAPDSPVYTSLFIGNEPLIFAKLGIEDLLFTISGAKLPDLRSMLRAPTFQKWQLWIATADGTKIGNEPLFTVG
ncbi:hypothetical protein U2S91_09395 [Stenotrophomonas maltophilia]|nr:hypothetical protein [Stenotrophomonas maltophilia]WQI22823.1 hypothetical protein U2S91_09395 [Stenotrophomonas maltophilia]